MPGNDQTGPRGLGPGTGWGRGICRRGAGTGQGLGYRFRRFFSPQNEKQALEEEVKFLEAELKAVKEAQKNLKD